MVGRAAHREPRPHREPRHPPAPSPAAAAWRWWALRQGAFQLPHGLFYMPLGPVPGPGARGRSVLGSLVDEVPLVHEGPLVPEGLHCITTKTWRRLKMKKHKASKRHRLLRHKAKNAK